ncbi:MAG: DUF3883 domain-containing protein [Gammaproteobacteria bacterium]|nr:DUF3883 domain-containing protein [Gammaproteobacteria bacterium]
MRLLREKESRKFASAKDHIDNLFHRRNKDDENSTSLTHDIECQIETALKGEQKIFFELIQNADDIEATEISLYLLENHLIVVHNGLPFNESDVEKICDIAQQRYHDKSNMQGKTGYKGIGFKSIFSASDRVQIISGEGAFEYSFRFDKQHFARSRTDGAAFPWPIIPIWTTDSNAHYEYKPAKYFEIIRGRGNRTCIIATLKAEVRAGLSQDLNLMKSDPKSILFLRSVNKIHLVEKDEVWIEKVRKEIEGHACTDLYIKKSISSGWILLDTWLLRRLTIDGEALSNVKIAISQANLSDYECPQRIRNAKETFIIYAVQVKDGCLQAVVSPLFSYLPTRVYCGIPFIVNADFLLNAERTQLTENPWNDMIMFHVSRGAFGLMRVLAQILKYRSQVLKLMPPEAAPMSLPSGLRNKYQQGFRDGVAVEAFIPAYKSNELLYLREACYDETNFFREFPEISSPNKLIDYSLDNISGILSHVSQFTAHHLVGKLKDYATRNKHTHFQKRLTKFLYEYSGRNHSLVSILKWQYFLLSSQNDIVSPQSVYFSETQISSISVPVKIHFIKSEIYDNNPSIKKWLEELGVKILTPIEFIRANLLPMIARQELSNQYLVQVTSFIKSYFDDLSHNDKQSLNKLGVLTQSGNYIPSSVAFLANIYNPRHKVEKDVAGVDRFVSEAYLGADLSQQNIESWKKFWIELGVGEHIISRTITVNERWVGLLYHDIGKMRPFNVNRLSEIQQFYYIDFIHLINFKDHHDAVWSAIAGAFSQTVYGVSAGVDTILHFLKNNEVCKDDSGSFHKTSDLFSRKLAPIVRGIKPIANYPVFLSEKSEEYLGIKIRVSIKDCLDVLMFLSINKFNDARYYNTFLAFLELHKDQAQNSDGILKEALRNNPVLLPAENGTLRSISDLKFFDIAGTTVGNSSRWFKHYIDLSVEDRLLLAEILGITVVNRDNLKVRTIPLGSSKSDIRDVKEKLTQYLPLIAYCATESHGHVAEKFEDLKQRLLPLEFVAVSLISLEHDGVELQTSPCYKKEDTIYYLNSISDIRTNREFCRLIGKLFKLTKKAKAILPWVTCLTQDQLLIQLDSEQYDLEAVKQAIANYMPQGPIQSTLLQPALPPMVDVMIESQPNDRQLIRGVEQLSLNETKPNAKNLAHLTFLATTKKVDVENIMIESEPLDLQPRLVIDDEQLPFPQIPSDGGYFQNDSGVVSRPRAERDIDKDKATGDWGEKLVYKWLKNRYRHKLLNKYNGFEIKPFEINSVNFGFVLKPTESVLSDTEVTVCWNNKPYCKNRMDSGLSFDLSIVKKSGGAIKTRIIEVKSTTSNGSADLYISGRELGLMVKYGAKCRLFRVYGVGSQNPRIAILKDPAKVVNADNPNISKVVIRM